MFLKSAKINNFKSLATENNLLHVDENITVLIGKNESGKSNILESLGLLDLWYPLFTNHQKVARRGQFEYPTISITYLHRF